MPLMTERARGYYLIRDKQMLGLGDEWPENAIVDPDGSKYALLKKAADGAVSAHVLHKTHLLDVEMHAEHAVQSGESAAVEIARMSGTFAGNNLWETVRRYVKPPPPEQIARKKHREREHMPPRPVVPTEPELGIKRFHVPFNMVPDVNIATPVMPDATIDVTTDAEDDFVIEGWASLPDVDRDREIVRANAFRKYMETFKANPVLLFNHNQRRSIGWVEKFEVTSKGFWVRAHVSKTAPDIRQLIREGALRAFSVTYKIHGFDYDSKGIRNILEAEPLEVSVVVIPAGRRALFTMSKSLKDGSDLECESCGAGDCTCDVAARGRVVAHKRFALAERDKPWTWDDTAARELVELGGSELLVDACTISRDGETPRLPHHRMVGGKALTVLGGVKAAMAQICSKSYIVSDDERARAHRHLSHHFEEFGMAPPLLELADTLELSTERVNTLCPEISSKSAGVSVTAETPEETTVRIRTEDAVKAIDVTLQGASMDQQKQAETTQQTTQEAKPTLQLTPTPPPAQEVASKGTTVPEGFSTIDVDTIAALERVANTPHGQPVDGNLARDVLLPGLKKYGF